MHRRHLIPISLAMAGIISLVTVVTVATQVNAAASTAPTTTVATIHTGPTPTGSALRRAVRGRVEHAMRARDVAALDALAQSYVDNKLGALVDAQKAVETPMWACIRDAESGDNYGLTSGAYGILISSWDAYAAVWSPYGSWSVPGQAPAAVQDLVADTLYRVGGGFGGWHDRCTGT
jgi:hypothetical protein